MIRRNAVVNGSWLLDYARRGALLIAGCSLALATMGASGCSSRTGSGLFGGFAVPSGTGEVTITRTDGASLNPKFPVAVYRYIDQNTADVYLTDLPLGRLADPADQLADLTGTVVHVYVFLVPEAGKTPIDPTACNATVRQVMFVNGARGIYAGAGFADTADPGSNNFDASIINASMRLSANSPDFADLLGPANLSGRFAARLDEETSRALSDRLAMVSAGLRSAVKK